MAWGLNDLVNRAGIDDPDDPAAQKNRTRLATIWNSYQLYDCSNDISKGKYVPDDVMAKARAIMKMEHEFAEVRNGKKSMSKENAEPSETPQGNGKTGKGKGKGRGNGKGIGKGKQAGKKDASPGKPAAAPAAQVCSVVPRLTG